MEKINEADILMTIFKITIAVIEKDFREQNGDNNKRI